MTTRASILLFSLALTVQADTLILKDGTHVTGRWWSIDASQVHFLVSNQLQHYPRPDVSAVTFGDATLPAPPPVSTTQPPATSVQPPAAAPQPARAPTLARSSDSPKPQPPSLTPSSDGAPPPAAAPQPARSPTLARPSDGAPPPTQTRPSGSAPTSAPQGGLSQPEELGAVYYWNGKVLIALEHNQAVERKSGSTQYWEMPGPQSRVRVNEAVTLVFILRLPQGVNPGSYNLFPLATVNGSRRTQSHPGRRGGLMTWPVDIEVNDATSLITYALRVKDLPTGEYSFSPSDSNDGYCFGVDPAAPGQ